MGLLLLRIWAYFLSSRHGSVEACLIHNLEVAGSNPEVGNIFSERYLRQGGEEERQSTTAALEKRERYGGMIMFFKKLRIFEFPAENQ